MTMFHVNPKGIADTCEAEKRPCPFLAQGAPHHPTLVGAQLLADGFSMEVADEAAADGLDYETALEKYSGDSGEIDEIFADSVERLREKYLKEGASDEAFQEALRDHVQILVNADAVSMNNVYLNAAYRGNGVFKQEHIEDAFYERRYKQDDFIHKAVANDLFGDDDRFYGLTPGLDTQLYRSGYNKISLLTKNLHGFPVTIEVDAPKTKPPLWSNGRANGVQSDYVFANKMQDNPFKELDKLLVTEYEKEAKARQWNVPYNEQSVLKARILDTKPSIEQGFRHLARKQVALNEYRNNDKTNDEIARELVNTLVFERANADKDEVYKHSSFVCTSAVGNLAISNDGSDAIRVDVAYEPEKLALFEHDVDSSDRVSFTINVFDIIKDELATLRG